MEEAEQEPSALGFSSTRPSSGIKAHGYSLGPNSFAKIFPSASTFNGLAR